MEIKPKQLDSIVVSTDASPAITHRTVKKYVAKIPLGVSVVPWAIVSLFMALGAISPSPVFVAIIALGIFGPVATFVDTGFRYEYMKGAILEADTVLSDSEDTDLFDYSFQMSPIFSLFTRTLKPFPLGSSKAIMLKQKWNTVYIEEQVAIDAGDEWDNLLAVIDTNYVSPNLVLTKTTSI